jgi:hypothetical protein
VVTHTCLACSSDPIGDLEKLHQQADEILRQDKEDQDRDNSRQEIVNSVADNGDDKISNDLEIQETLVDSEKQENERRKLTRMGLNQALRINKTR